MHRVSIVGFERLLSDLVPLPKVLITLRAVVLHMLMHEPSQRLSDSEALQIIQHGI